MVLLYMVTFTINIPQMLYIYNWLIRGFPSLASKKHVENDGKLPSGK